MSSVIERKKIYQRKFSVKVKVEEKWTFVNGHGSGRRKVREVRSAFLINWHRLEGFSQYKHTLVQENLKKKMGEILIYENIINVLLLCAR